MGAGARSGDGLVQLVPRAERGLDGERPIFLWLGGAFSSGLPLLITLAGTGGAYRGFVRSLVDLGFLGPHGAPSAAAAPAAKSAPAPAAAPAPSRPTAPPAARPAAVSMLDVGLAFATVLVGIAIAVMIFIEAPKGS